jgi:hypothetical protein
VESLSTHRFDCTLAYDVFFHIACCVGLFIFNNNNKKKKKKKFGENSQDIISLGLLDIACILA